MFFTSCARFVHTNFGNTRARARTLDERLFECERVTRAYENRIMCLNCENTILHAYTGRKGAGKAIRPNQKCRTVKRVFICSHLTRLKVKVI